MRCAARLALLGIIVACCFQPEPAQAGCTTTPIVGGVQVDCNATIPPDPTPGATVIPSGNNIVQFFSGTYNGSVTILGGNNTITMSGGQINSNFVSGTGNDRFTMSAGAITGNIDQGDGADTFSMTGGVIGSLQQGGGLDTFFMSGGTITGAFTEGDFITITGGTIGSVDMTIGNNVFTMSGGIVLGNVVAGFQNDTFTLSGGVIGGTVNLGNGTNTLAVTGGQIGNGITTGTGVDTLLWSGGGTIAGAINLGAGNDTATLRNLLDASLAMSLLAGGAGTDRLVFDNTIATGIARLQSWETFELTNNTQLTLDGSLTLGDAGTLTGALSIDATSKLLAGNGANPSILPFAVGQLVTVTNAGLIDLTNGTAAATDTLTIVGNYVGASGLLALQTVLGSDSSPSDKLIISGGAATGTTVIQITNLNGTGAQTVTDGILVVQAINGATTPGTFSLSGIVAAGAFEYLLFKGGVTAGTSQNWYLQSSIPSVPGGQTPPTAAPGSPPLPPPPSPGAAPIPLYRPEVAVHLMVPEIARTLGLTMLGTFHQRQGDKMLLLGDRASAVWGRVFGEHMRESFANGVQPGFDGIVGGLQAGADVLRFESQPGHRDHVGLYVGQAQAVGDVKGFVIGLHDAPAGRMSLGATSLGAYWTHIGPMGWYVDAVLQASAVDGTPRSDRGSSAKASGNSLIASLEGGYPIVLSSVLRFEPQAQVIWQRVSFSETRDAFSTIAFDQSDAFAGRVGARLQARFGSGGVSWQPYLLGNLWWNADGADVVTFATNALGTDRKNGASGELSIGSIGQLMPGLSIYGDAGYLSNFSGEQRQAFRGNLGLRLTW